MVLPRAPIELYDRLGVAPSADSVAVVDLGMPMAQRSLNKLAERLSISEKFRVWLCSQRIVVVPRRTVALTAKLPAASDKGFPNKKVTRKGNSRTKKNKKGILLEKKKGKSAVKNNNKKQMSKSTKAKDISSTNKKKKTAEGTRPRKKQKTLEVIDLTKGDVEKPKTRIEPRASAPKSTDEKIISVCSYNVWFGPQHPLHPFERMSAICDAIAADMPVFVGLQEVTAELSQMLFPLLESVGYKVVCQDLTLNTYGCAVAVRDDACHVVASGFQPYRVTIMGRGAVWVLAKLVGMDRKVLFTTTHLESFLRNHPTPGSTYTGAEERELQIKQLKEFCHDCMDKSSTDMAVITGDLNWDDQRKRSLNTDKPLVSLLGEPWCDAWLETRPGQDGYTYDSKESAMLRGNLRRRFDRCLLLRRSRQELPLVETKLIGKDPIPGLKWTKAPHPMARKQTPTVVPVLPSDHFGLLVKLQSRSS